jgi:hypothetical protein
MEKTRARGEPASTNEAQVDIVAVIETCGVPKRCDLEPVRRMVQGDRDPLELNCKLSCYNRTCLWGELYVNVVT